METMVHSLMGDERYFIKLYFSVTTLKSHILIMDFIKGGDLFDLFKKEERLATTEVKMIVCQLADALNSLHQHNIIHNDIKLENIIYNRYKQIYIADYGLCRIVGQKSCHDGTMDYFSPEKIAGHDYHYNFDWWALGILAHELITGLPPFKNDFDEKLTVEQLAKRQQRKLVFSNSINKDAQSFISNILKFNINYRLNKYNDIIKHNFLM